jgi:parallel beta-helix repeat protein
MLLSVLCKVLPRGVRRGGPPRVRTPLLLEALEERVALSRAILVDDDRVQCPNADFTSIQAAVNAARPGDTIRVCPGTYREQVLIGPGKNGLTLLSEKPLQAVIQAPPAPNNTTDAIVDIDKARDVTLRGFKITGPLHSLQAGVLVEEGATATVRDNLVTNMFNDTGSGIGIAVGVDEGPTIGPASARILDNVVEMYQKAGIVITEDGSSAEVRGNVVRGVGPTSTVAQYGIQVSFGADAEVEKNAVSGNIFTGTGAEVSGILIFQAGRVEVSKNDIFNNQNGIITEETDRVEVDHNHVFNNLLAGIYFETSKHSKVEHNRVDHNGQDGIFLDDGSTDFLVAHNDSNHNGRDGIFLQDADNNRIEHNKSNDNGGDGIHVDANSTGNQILKNKMRGNGVFDAEDDSTGTGTAGTANLWKGNHCETQNRPGLCDMHGHGGDDDDDD